MSEEFRKLYRAIVSDDQKDYTELRSSNTDVSILLKETAKHSDDTLLHVAANWNRIHIAEVIIDLQPSLLLEINAKGETPLHVAAGAGSENVTQLIMGRRHQIEAAETGETILRKKTENEKETALHKAVRNGHLEVVKLLIREDPGLTKLVNKDSDSPLFMAVDTWQFEIACNILTVSDCSFKGRKNMNALHAAIALIAKRGLCTALASGGKLGIKHLLKSKEIKKSNEPKSDEAVEKSWRETISLVSTITATVSFTAALSVPGGFKIEGPAEGTAALAQKSDFRNFVIFNAIAYGLSVFSLLTSWDIPGLSSIFNHLTPIMSQMAILAMAGAFYYGSSAVLGPSEAKLANKVGNIMSACGLPVVFALCVELMTLITKWRTLRYLRS